MWNPHYLGSVFVILVKSRSQIVKPSVQVLLPILQRGFKKREINFFLTTTRWHQNRNQNAPAREKWIAIVARMSVSGSDGCRKGREMA